MEQMPHRKEFEDLLNKAHEEALRDNDRIDEKTSESVESASSSESINAMELDYESINPEKVKLFVVSEMIGKPLSEVAEYVKEKFSDKYYIPGRRYKEYIQMPENASRIPKGLAIGKYLVFLGQDNRDFLSISETSKITGAELFNWSDENAVVLIEK